MRNWIRAVAPVMLAAWAAANARADAGIIPRVTGSDSGDLALVIGGLSLSLAVILGGLLLVVRARRQFLRRAGVLRIIGFLALGALLVMLVGPILSSDFGHGISCLAFSMAVILGSLWLVGHRRRKGDLLGAADGALEE